MPRIARFVVERMAHHITQWGNNRQPVFFDEQDRRRYLELLAGQAETFGLRILGYCLMGNHIHLIAIPRRPDSLARAVGRTHFQYTLHINRKYGRSGHLWQNRFYSCLVEGNHLWEALRYVDLNPVRTRLRRVAWRYPWSSARAHCANPWATQPL